MLGDQRWLRARRPLHGDRAQWSAGQNRVITPIDCAGEYQAIDSRNRDAGSLRTREHRVRRTDEEQAGANGAELQEGPSLHTLFLSGIRKVALVSKALSQAGGYAPTDSASGSSVIACTPSRRST
jgi:hypothetical protein